MDIAKYMTTAVVLSSVFVEAATWVIYVVGGISVVISLICGLFLVSDKPLKSIKRKE